MSILRTIVSDAANISRVCGPWVGSRWLAEIGLNWRECLRERNLQSADRALGAGPFRARLGTARAVMVGDAVFSGLREIWARDQYLGGGFLHIPPNGTVVDLGCSAGNFTLLALGHGPDVRVVSVDANTALCEHGLRPSLRVNGWQDRPQIINAFVGGQTQAQDRMIFAGQCTAARKLSEHELIAEAGLTRIDFLKSDIGGSEFALLTRGSRLLAMCEQLAVELHAWAGRARDFVSMLKETGFECRVSEPVAEPAVVLARRKD